MYAYPHLSPTHTSKYNNDSSLETTYRYYYYYTIGQTHWRLSTGLEVKVIEKERERVRERVREWEMRENESERKIGYDNRRDRVLYTTRKHAPPLNPHTVYNGGEHLYIIYTGCVSAVDVFGSVFLEITFLKYDVERLSLPYSRI